MLAVSVVITVPHCAHYARCRSRCRVLCLVPRAVLAGLFALCLCAHCLLLCSNAFGCIYKSTSLTRDCAAASPQAPAGLSGPFPQTTPSPAGASRTRSQSLLSQTSHIEQSPQLPFSRDWQTDRQVNYASHTGSVINSCYNHHMAGMVNTALLDHASLHTHNHTPTYTHYHLYLYLLL